MPDFDILAYERNADYAGDGVASAFGGSGTIAKKAVANVKSIGKKGRTVGGSFKLHPVWLIAGIAALYFLTKR